MKRLFLILTLSFLGIVFILIVLAHIVLNTGGKTILANYLTKELKRPTTIESAWIGFPLNLKIKKIAIEGLIKADEVYLKPSLIGFILGKIIISELELVKPAILLERSSDGKIDVGFKRNENTGLFLAIRRLKISGARVDFLDKKIKPEGLMIHIRDLDLDINNIFVFPYSAITRFKLTAAIPWVADSAQVGSATLEGWVDVTKKDGKAELQIVNIDAIYLYPYYERYLSLERTSIERATLRFTSSLSAHNNNLTADCHLILDQLVFKDKDAQKSQPQFDKATVSDILDIFKSDEGKVTLDFVIRTSLSKPIFGIHHIQSAISDTFVRKNKALGAQGIFKVPGDVMSGAVRGTAELSRALVSGVSAVGSEVKKAFEAAFRREPREPLEKANGE